MYFSILLLATTTLAAPSWTSVNTGGGGGFVPSVVFHPNASGVAYARTDIGGLYRLNSDDTWTAITDSITFDDTWNRWGIDALAVDPSSATTVYAAAGMYTNSWDPLPGSLIRSYDSGTTWNITTLPFKVGGNMPGRGTGERLAVDPANGNIIYFGARSGHGLWRSTNAGETFENVTSFTAVGTYAPDPKDTNGYNNDLQGLTFVTFDSTSGVTSSGATAHIIVGTADNITASVYHSTDGGSTWSAISGQPGKFFPHKCRLSPSERALYFSYADGSGPYDGTAGAVYRYDIVAGTWKDITPVSGSDLYFGFGGLSLDASNPGTLMVASLNSWFPDGQIFRSTDSGATWSKFWSYTSYPTRAFRGQFEYSNAPWIGAFLSGDDKKTGWMMESLEINPHDSNHWLYGTGLTLFGGRDLTKWDSSAITISVKSPGIEEMAVLSLSSAPSGPELLAGVADDSGFTYSSASSVSTAPSTMWGTPKFTGSTGVDYAGSNPQHVVRSGNVAGTAQVAVSTDGGNTWTNDTAAPTTASGGPIAISADGKAILWSTSNSGVLLSTGTYAAVSSLPSGALIASDKKDASIFYAASGSSFYVSTNSGSSFSASSITGVSSIRGIAVDPNTAGTLFISADSGIYTSTDSGKSFSRLGSLTDGGAISVGKGSSGVNIYAVADGPDGTRVYASKDSGATWSDIQGTQGFGALSGCVIAGSWNEANRVYVGTNGRGTLYASV